MGPDARDHCRVTHLGIDYWHARIEACALHEELLLVVSAYLGEWRPQDINRLPVRLTCPIPSIEHLHQRAIELIHSEVNFRGSNADWGLLGELTVVITAAAVRARSIEVEAMQSRSLEDAIHEEGSNAP
jgi:hypothetical protein